MNMLRTLTKYTGDAGGLAMKTKPLLRLKYVIAAAVLALSAAAANATTFNITENLIFHNFIAPPPPGVCPVCDGGALPNGTLTGTVDIINGSITSVDLVANVALGFHFTTIVPNGSPSSCLGCATLNGQTLTHSAFPTFTAILNLFTDYEAGSSDPHDPIGRWTVAPVPLPTALPLFATGLGALGLLSWRRKRKAIA